MGRKPFRFSRERWVKATFGKITLLLLVLHASLVNAQTPSPPTPQADSSLRIGRFNVGFVAGYYQPDLSTLNGVINNRNQSIMEDPNFLLPGNPNFTVEQRNIEAGKIGGSPWLGLESQWDFSPSFAVRLTGGAWKGERLASDTISTFLRSNLPEISAPRTARYNLILDQIFLDWRYYFLNDPQRGRVSLDLGILGMTVGFLTLDSLVKVVTPEAPNGGFASISSTEAMGVAYTSRFGLTGEYLLGKRLALALSAHYILGRMTDLKVKRYVEAGFPQVPVPEPLSIRAGTPLPTTLPVPHVEETVRTATTQTDLRRVENIGPAQNLILELDGLEVSGYLRFYF